MPFECNHNDMNDHQDDTILSFHAFNFHENEEDDDFYIEFEFLEQLHFFYKNITKFVNLDLNKKKCLWTPTIICNLLYALIFNYLFLPKKLDCRFFLSIFKILLIFSYSGLIGCLLLKPKHYINSFAFRPCYLFCSIISFMVLCGFVYYIVGTILDTPSSHYLLYIVCINHSYRYHKLSSITLQNTKFLKYLLFQILIVVSSFIEIFILIKHLFFELFYNVEPPSQ